MANLPPGSAVRFLAGVGQKLRLTAPSNDLLIAVNSGALKSPGSRHTQVVVLAAGQVAWTAGVGEDLLEPRVAPPNPTARQSLRNALMVGGRLWEIVLPGGLLAHGVAGPLSTIYDHDRPWLIIGESSSSEPIAVPLNAPTNPKWYAPLVSAVDLSFAGAKDSQLELAHAWTLPSTATTIGQLAPTARAALATTILKFYN